MDVGSETSGRKITVSDQRSAISRSLAGVEVDRCYAFALLMLERLESLCETVFPVGLPTRNIPYEVLQSAIDDLWRRPMGRTTLPELHTSSEAWRPLTPTGHVEHRVGAGLGFYVAESVAKLAIVEFDRAEVVSLVEWIWEATTSTLFRLPSHPDYSQRFTDVELDPSLNRALLDEYAAQASDIADLQITVSWDPDALRLRSRTVARDLAEVMRVDLRTP